tara:strand:- start:2605 stop:3033 length:429 start_codon:yes stop_codon:yes gene_type:complete
MSDININSLYDSVLKRRVIKYKTYESILQNCHKRIKRHAENDKLECIYSIPAFIIGTPLYDFNELKVYIINSLKKSGFQLKLINNNLLYISWDLKNKKKKIQKQTNKTNYRSIVDYNPTGLFVNDNSVAIQNINEKLNLIKI